jgi:hypothetical protein
VLMGIGGYQAYIYAFRQHYHAIYRPWGTVDFLGWFRADYIRGGPKTHTFQNHILPSYSIPHLYLQRTHILPIQKASKHQDFFSTKHVFLVESVPSQKSSLNLSNEERRHLIQCGMVDEPDNLMYSIWLIYLLTLNEKLVPEN